MTEGASVRFTDGEALLDWWRRMLEKEKRETFDRAERYERAWADIADRFAATGEWAAIRHMAVTFSDDPGYREEWKPDHNHQPRCWCMGATTAP